MSVRYKKISMWYSKHCEFGGLSVVPHYILHGFEMVKIIMITFCQQHPLSHLLVISLQALQLECGLSGDILDSKTPILTYTSCNL